MKNSTLLLALTALPGVCFAADLTGTWKSEFDSQIGRQKYTYTLKQEGDKLTGKANSEVNDQKRETPLTEGKVDGDKVSFVEMLNINGNDIRIAYSGTLSTNGVFPSPLGRNTIQKIKSPCPICRPTNPFRVCSMAQSRWRWPPHSVNRPWPGKRPSTPNPLSL